MQFGLSESTIEKMKSVFSRFHMINQIIIFGSRAKGNYRENSDIDLAIKASNFDLTTLQKVETALEELYLPYTVDVVDYSKIENIELINHINRVGQIFYQKNEI